MKKIVCLALLLSAAALAGAHSINSCLDKNGFTGNSSSMATQTVHPKKAMTDAQLDYILNRMRQKRNDAGKIFVLKSGIKGKGLTVDQLARLLNQFLTDDSKLECSEYAYRYTVDSKNYLKLEDLFAEQRNKDALEDFVKKNR